MKDKQIKEYATYEICFVISYDRKKMCCPKGIFFNTRKAKNARYIRFPESCQNCEIKECQGTYQTQIQIGDKWITTDEKRTDYSEDEDIY